jgi:ribosomal protein S15P/S13E
MKKETLRLSFKEVEEKTILKISQGENEIELTEEQIKVLIKNYKSFKNIKI